MTTPTAKPKTKQTCFDSSAGVIPKRTHGRGIWGGERKVVNIRIDAKLYEATKPHLKRYFGSVCAAIEPYLATIYSIATTNKLSGESGVIPSITVDIKNMNIRRHMRVRRRYVVEEEEGVDYLVSEYCGVVSCMAAPTVKLQSLEGKVLWFCKKHYKNPLRLGWKRLEVKREEDSPKEKVVAHE